SVSEPWAADKTGIVLIASLTSRASQNCSNLLNRTNASRLRHPNTLKHVSNKEKIMTTSTLSTATRGFSHPSDARPAEASGTFLIGDIPVHRLGFGAMQLTGD